MEYITDERISETVDGLRELADWLETNPEVGERILSWPKVYLFTNGREDFVSTCKALGGMRVKSADDNYFNVERTFGGITLQVTVARGLVCEKKVTTREVTRRIPDPEVVASVPLVDVTETEEVIEWECEPSILAAVGDPA